MVHWQDRPCDLSACFENSPSVEFLYMNFATESLKIHQKLKGKIEVKSKIHLRNRHDLSIAYTPGVGAVSTKVAKDPELVYQVTIKSNSVAVVSDGSAVLGLGNIGALAALPVMEGKCLLFAELADINAFPIVLATQDVAEIVKTVKAVSPTFGGINLEDISAPRCFKIEENLKKIGIPVFHDDQHGTAIVATAALENALKVVGKKLTKVKIVINGAGAAGNALAKLLVKQKVKELIVLDSKGIIFDGRADLDLYKKQLAKITNPGKVRGGLREALTGADVFIGVSVAGVLKPEWVKAMNKDPIVFAMANPIPEIMPDKAVKAGAAVVATGRSDFPNQINNVLAFPGVFRGALNVRAKVINQRMKMAAAEALAKLVKNPTKEYIIPNPLDRNVVPAVAKAVADAYSQ